LRAGKAGAAAPLNLRVAAGLGRDDGKILRQKAPSPRSRLASRIPPAALRVSALAPAGDAAEILAEALTCAARSGRIEAMAFLAEQIGAFARPLIGSS